MFKKSSFCTESLCVEVQLGSTTVVMRDPSGSTCVYTEEEWQAFTAGVRNGEFDLAR